MWKEEGGGSLLTEGSSVGRQEHVEKEQLAHE